jgi:hypothetical protein
LATSGGNCGRISPTVNPPADCAPNGEKGDWNPAPTGCPIASPGLEVLKSDAPEKGFCCMVELVSFPVSSLSFTGGSMVAVAEPCESSAESLFENRLLMENAMTFKVVILSQLLISS